MSRSAAPPQTSPWDKSSVIFEQLSAMAGDGTAQSCLVLRPTGAYAAATLSKLSDSRFCLQSMTSFAVGERLEIEVDGWRVSAEVEWTLLNRAGGILGA